MTKRKPKTTNQISEPEISYSSSLLQQTEGKLITISSLEEQEEANYKYWLSLTPLQRFQLHYKMASAFWQFKSTIKKKYKNIIIK